MLLKKIADKSEHVGHIQKRLIPPTAVPSPSSSRALISMSTLCRPLTLHSTPHPFAQGIQAFSRIRILASPQKDGSRHAVSRQAHTDHLPHYEAYPFRPPPDAPRLREQSNPRIPVQVPPLSIPQRVQQPPLRTLRATISSSRTPLPQSSSRRPTPGDSPTSRTARRLPMPNANANASSTSLSGPREAVAKSPRTPAVNQLTSRFCTISRLPNAREVDPAPPPVMYWSKALVWG